MAWRWRHLGVLLLLAGLGTLALWDESFCGEMEAEGSATAEVEQEDPAGAAIPAGAQSAAGAPLAVVPSSTPRSAAQALAAAAAARRAGDRVGEEAMLVAAMAGGDLAQVARVELAELILDGEPRRAASGLLPVLDAPGSRELQGIAVDLVVKAVTADRAAVDERELSRVAAGLPRSEARRLELAVAGHDPSLRRERLGRLLQESADDLVAVAAAEGLAGAADLDGRERWNAARAFYRHGRYTQVLELLADLPAVGVEGAPAWELAFIPGRACFRLGRWDEAAAWYRVAAAAADTRDGRAMLEVHRSRSLELGGRLAEAAEAARRAVMTRATDERRLHLLRVRLRQGRVDLATEGLGRLRRRRTRGEGSLRLALHDLAAGRVASARSRMESIRLQPWAGPAAVIRARLAADRGEWAESVAVLDGSAERLDPFWGAAARRVMASVPATEQVAWRQRSRQRLGEGTGLARWRALQRWATLETEPEALAELRREVVATGGFEPPDAGLPSFTSPLATKLWSVGLTEAAGRFDPGGFPRGTAGEAIWSARTLLTLGRPRMAIRLAESAARQVVPRVPARVLPAEVRELLYPLPWPELVAEVAAACGIEGPFLAGLVREESRWQPTALSAVGARGLTQLMPATAAAAAARVGWPAPAADALFEPRVALSLGAVELGRLMVAFAGHRAAAVAGYNAGEAQARQWLEQCGTGCTEEHLVASITFDATRGYVAEVLAATEEYRELYPELETPTRARARTW